MLTVNRILIILAVEILDGQARGCNIANLIINTTGRHETLRRSVYVTAHRMCDLKLLTQYRDGNRPYYRVTKRGRALVLKTLNEFAELNKAAKKIIGRVA